MATAKGSPPQRRGGGLGGFMGVFVTILVIELLLDVVLFPADEVLVPAELIGDALFFTVALIGMWKGGASSGGGRQVGASPKARAITTTARVIRGNRRGVAGRGRGHSLSGSQVGMIAGVWLLFAAVLGFQWWWSIHHPILQILTLPFEIIFDLIGILVSVFVTVFALTGQKPGAGLAREVGA